MDTLLKTENNIEFFLISPDSDWWGKLIENGFKANCEFVPPLTDRMPMEAIFNRFKNENAFTIVASANNAFAGCFCCYLKHPEHHKPTMQFVLIAKEFRNQKLTRILSDLACTVFMNNRCQLIEATTWSTNYRSQKAFARNGFYLKKIIENDRGSGIHTLVYEKSLLFSGLFTGLSSLVICNKGNNRMIAKYADEIRSLTLQNENIQEQLFIQLMDDEFLQERNKSILETSIRSSDLNSEVPIGMINDHGKFVLVPELSCSTGPGKSNYSSLGMVIKLGYYISELVKRMPGKFLLLCYSSSIPFAPIELSNILFPDKALQDKTDELIDGIAAGKTEVAAISQLASGLDHFAVSGIILGCLELCQISDAVKKILPDTDVINVFQILKYDIADSWRRVQNEIVLRKNEYNENKSQPNREC